jgi:cellulose synthase/poly-beta-1,6-N-acetylglucosamine synthase-like glycosyltransferase
MESPIRYSIIIPSRCRPQALQNCLQAIQHLDYPKNNFEVIVVLDGDKENYERFISLSTHTDFSLQVVSQERAGPSAARNMGARLAKGKYLAFTDDDCLLPSNWLTQVDSLFALHPECLLGGQIMPLATADHCSRASHALLNAVYQFYNDDPAHSAFFASCHMLMPKSAFDELQGFDVNFQTAEDRDFCSRWCSRGWPMFYNPSLVIHHDQKDSFISFFRRHFRYGRGGYRFHLKQARQQQASFHLAPKKFYHHLLSVLGNLTFSKKKYRLVFLLLISQLASLLGFLLQALSWEFPKTPESGRK